MAHKYHAREISVSIVQPTTARHGRLSQPQSQPFKSFQEPMQEYLHLKNIQTNKLYTLQADDIDLLFGLYDRDVDGRLEPSDIRVLAHDCVQRLLLIHRDDMKQHLPAHEQHPHGDKHIYANMSIQELQQHCTRELLRVMKSRVRETHGDECIDRRLLIIEKHEFITQWNKFAREYFYVGDQSVSSKNNNKLQHVCMCSVM